MSDSRSKLLPFRSYRGRDAYAFVSYAHDDSTAVFNLLADIYRRGINVWYDEGINPGVQWRRELAGAIEGSSLKVFKVCSILIIKLLLEFFGTC